jgi:hypothetical protein
MFCTRAMRLSLGKHFLPKLTRAHFGHCFASVGNFYDALLGRDRFRGQV